MHDFEQVRKSKSQVTLSGTVRVRGSLQSAMFEGRCEFCKTEF